jgi:chaperonin cofactor prefoldin
MAEYNIGDKVILKDDGQVYKVVGVRTEERIVLFDLEQGDERASKRLTVLRSQIEVLKAYTPKQPQIVIYKKSEE